MRTPWRRAALIVLALVGIGVAGYLSYTKLANAPVWCGGVRALEGCNDVNNSRWGEIILPVGGPAGLHIPTAVLGLAMYVTLLVLLAVPLGRLRPLADQAVFGITFAGVLYSAYLTYIELFVLYKVCPWCVASAVTVTLMCIVSFPQRRLPVEDDQGGE